MTNLHKHTRGSSAEHD